MSFSLVSTGGLALLALGVTMWMLVLGAREKSRWDRAVSELRDVGRIFEETYGARSHRSLYRSFDELSLTLMEAAKARPSFGWIWQEIGPSIGQVHRRAVVGASGAWPEVRDLFLEHGRRPLSLNRAAAGVVLLIGLAGTVLGFLESMPGIRQVLAGQSAPVLGNSRAQTTDYPEMEDVVATEAGRKLEEVFGRLEGVFIATFCGVLAALVLTAYGSLYLEPSFERFAREVDFFGTGWWAPLLQTPDTLLDDALRSELRSYFEEVSRKLDLVLSPLVHELKVRLEAMSGLAFDFSTNVRLGTDTLTTFHQAVQQLGGSAQDTLGRLEEIVGTSRDFIQQVASLQQQGMRELSQTLREPVEELARSVGALRESLEGQENRFDPLRTVVQDLKLPLLRGTELLERQNEALGHLATALQSPERKMSEDLRQSLAPLVKVLEEQNRLMKPSLPPALVPVERLSREPEQTKILYGIQELMSEALGELRHKRVSWWRGLTGRLVSLVANRRGDQKGEFVP